MAEFEQINNSTFKTTSEEVRQTIVGNSKSALFEPCVEIIPWEVEHGDCLKIWKDTGASLSVGTNLTDKEHLKWQDSKEELTFSPLGTDIPEAIKDNFYNWNGAQFVIRLTEKPKIDLDGFARFRFRMSGHEDMDFLPQPELIAPGFWQPDWGIDGIAVYHKSKAWSREGASFKTGQVCFIKRCWCLDDLGNFTWGKWEYDLDIGELVKCFPASAFNYPGATSWHVDATFGNTAMGAATQSLRDLTIGTRDGKTPAATGTGNHMTAWLTVETAATNTKCNVYLTSDDSQVANAQTDEVEAAIAAATEVDFNFSTPPTFTNGINYDLWAWCAGDSGGDSKLHLNLSFDESQYDSLTYGAWPNPVVPDATFSRRASIYVDYTAAATTTTTAAPTTTTTTPAPTTTTTTPAPTTTTTTTPAPTTTTTTTAAPTTTTTTAGPTTTTTTLAPGILTGCFWADAKIRGPNLPEKVFEPYHYIYGEMCHDGTVATQRITSSDSPYAVLARDHVIFCDTDGGAIETDLPAGVQGKNYKIINCGSSGNDVTAEPNGTEKLYGVGLADEDEITLSDGENINIHFDAVEFWW